MIFLVCIVLGSTGLLRDRMVIVSVLANAVAGAGYLCIIVERAKKCLDFTVTLYIVHFFGCMLHSGLPASIEWWVLHFTSLVFMAVIGEWLCMRREMRDIPLGSNIGRGMATRNRVPPEPSKGLKETLSGSLKSMARVSGSSGSLKN
mmetsp:Transcript_24381/g.46265  ORF Transcript_24381/g.46265 Transcript_24381/m.46265 type:complete len:147 (-) Transcript_24381:425-865(-)